MMPVLVIHPSMIEALKAEGVEDIEELLGWTVIIIDGASFINDYPPCQHFSTIEPARPAEHAEPTRKGKRIAQWRQEKNRHRTNW